MQLVDEENDLAGGFGDLLEHGLQAILKFAAVLGASDERGQVESNDALGLQSFRHVPGDDALRQAFDNGGLTDAGLADQDGIVLGAAREDLHDAADFDVASDDGVELAATRLFGKVAGVLFEGAESGFRRLRGDAVAAADTRERLEKRFARNAQPDQKLPRRVGLAGGDGQQDMLGGNVFLSS